MGYDEDEAFKPTKQELQYLRLRQRMKEAIRKRSGFAIPSTRSGRANNMVHDNYGSFFGPAQSIIAPRLIQETKSLLDNPHLTSKFLKSNHQNNKALKPRAPKTKAEKIKNSRDYSFLFSEDPELPALTAKDWQPLIQKKEIIKESSNLKMVSKLPVSSSSKPHPIKKPQAKSSSVRDIVRENRPCKPPIKKPREQSCSIRDIVHEDRPKKRKVCKEYYDSDDDDEEDVGKAIGLIRSMFGYDPSKYDDDEYDGKMESNFEDILKEEKRSAKLARKEDQEELRKIEQEEKRERLRKGAMKRNLSA